MPVTVRDGLSHAAVLREMLPFHCERPGGPLIDVAPFAPLAPLAFPEELIDVAPLAPLAPLGGPEKLIDVAPLAPLAPLAPVTQAAGITPEASGASGASEASAPPPLASPRHKSASNQAAFEADLWL